MIGIKTFEVVREHCPEGVLFHWRCELREATELLFVPEPCYELIVAASGQLVLPQAHLSMPRYVYRNPGSQTFRLQTMSRVELFGTRFSMDSTYGSQLMNPIAILAERFDAYANFEDYVQQVNKRVIAHVPRTAPESLGFSDRTLRRNFKKRYGISSRALARLQKINAYMASECQTVTRPIMSGSIDYARYYDQPHFIRTFRQVVGMTPKEFFAVFDGLPEQLLAASYNYNHHRIDTLQK
ncbi:MAG: helix-turn-helix domain-containing protein [Candidatus Saccharibacteria bacterium]|nr:helix-turn-helix domain-containing protein [Candidatus Saccharibacteria bacterium]